MSVQGVSCAVPQPLVSGQVVHASDKNERNTCIECLFSYVASLVKKMYDLTELLSTNPLLAYETISEANKNMEMGVQLTFVQDGAEIRAEHICELYSALSRILYSLAAYAASYLDISKVIVEVEVGGKSLLEVLRDFKPRCPRHLDLSVPDDWNDLSKYCDIVIKIIETLPSPSAQPINCTEYIKIQSSEYKQLIENLSDLFARFVNGDLTYEDFRNELYSLLPSLVDVIDWGAAYNEAQQLALENSDVDVEEIVNDVFEKVQKCINQMIELVALKEALKKINEKTPDMRKLTSLMQLVSSLWEGVQEAMKSIYDRLSYEKQNVERLVSTIIQNYFLFKIIISAVCLGTIAAGDLLVVASGDYTRILASYNDAVVAAAQYGGSADWADFVRRYLSTDQVVMNVMAILNEWQTDTFVPYIAIGLSMSGPILSIKIVPLAHTAPVGEMTCFGYPEPQVLTIVEGFVHYAVPGANTYCASNDTMNYVQIIVNVDSWSIISVSGSGQGYETIRV